MGDLVEWLRAQLDDDERIARAADAELSNVFTRIATFDPEMAADERHIMEHRPARVLREIDAKREALAHYERIRQRTVQGDEVYVLAEGAVSKQIQIMAATYADRPGFREEWRP